MGIEETTPPIIRRIVELASEVLCAKEDGCKTCKKAQCTQWNRELRGAFLELRMSEGK